MILEMEAVQVGQGALHHTQNNSGAAIPPSTETSLGHQDASVSGGWHGDDLESDPTRRRKGQLPSLLELLSAMEVKGVLEEVPRDVVVSIQVRRFRQCSLESRDTIYGSDASLHRPNIYLPKLCPTPPKPEQFKKI